MMLALRKNITLLLKYFQVSFFIFFAVSSSYSQKCHLTGIIKDSVYLPLEYVNVELYIDSNFYKGTTTDSLGLFRFDKVECNEIYQIKIRHIGYKSITDTISHLNKPYSYEMNIDPTLLNEVVITGKRPQIRREADRLIYNVDNSFITGNNSAFEILKTTPSVWVDGNGTIRVNGKEGVSVMINDKPLQMGGIQLQNYLNGINGEDVISIEVIAVPGSEFEASKKGGVININMKKRFVDGYNARLFAGYEQGRYPEYSTGVFSNYKKGKLTTTANFYIFERNSFIDNQEKRTSYSMPFALSSSFFSKNNVNNNQLRLGADYDINDKNNINIEYVRTYNNNDISTNAFTKLNVDTTERDIYGIYNTQSENIYNGGTFNYNWYTDTLGSTLKVLIDYMSNDNLTNGYFDSEYRLESGELTKENTTLNELGQFATILSNKVDYNRIFHSGNSIQGGIKFGRSNVNNDAIEKEKIDGVFVINSDRTNSFTYTESIYAGYLNYSGKVSKLRYKLGARIEDSYIKGAFSNGQVLFDVRYFDFFPSLFLLWEFGKESNNSLSFAGNRKINRPFFEALNPFEYVLNQFSISRGNPSLKPEYATNIEVNYTIKNNYNFGIIYSKYDDIINNVIIANEEVAINETQNISNSTLVGGNFSCSFTSFKDKLKTYFFVSMANSDYSSNLVNESLTNFSVRINNNFTFSNTLRLNTTLFYSSSELYGNIIYEPYGQVDLSISKSFLDGKLNLSLGIKDVFETQNGNSKLIDSSEEIITTEMYQSRKAQVYLFYNFSSGKSFKKKRIESSDEGEKSRLKN